MKNSAIATDQFRKCSCLNQIMQIERGVCGKMVIMKYNGFIFDYMARLRTKFGSHRKLCIECFHSKFLVPAVKS